MLCSQLLGDPVINTDVGRILFWGGPIGQLGLKNFFRLNFYN